MIRILLTSAAACAALTVGACGGGDGDRRTDLVRTALDRDDRDQVRLVAVDRLDCPEKQGDLMLLKAAEDGLRCVYTGADGAEVELSLLPVGEAGEREALAPIEAELKALLPAEGRLQAVSAVDSAEIAAHIAQARADASAAIADAAAEASDAGAEAADAAAAAAEAVAAGHGSVSPEERVDIDLPGLRIKAEGDAAYIRLPGISIDASDESSNVRIAGGAVNVKEGPGGERVSIAGPDENVEIRAQGDGAAEVRVRKKGDDIRATYILTNDRAEGEEWGLVGYEARGPKAGPLVVAVVKARDRANDDLFDDMKDLIKRNSGSAGAR